MRFLFLVTFIPLISCKGQHHTITQSDTLNPPQQLVQASETDVYYNENKGNNLPSQSIGEVSSGSLKNGKLIPFDGVNYRYFDQTSYTSGRAFVHHKLLKTVLDSYHACEEEIPNRHFCIMECSNKEGGKISPHRTHQNGLSIDFMTPLLKDGIAYYGLDSLGAEHYLLDFDENGIYTKDKTITIDFETMAKHIYLLEEHAIKNGLKISKVILKTELKDELYATFYGRKLLNSSVYITKNLSPIINSLHDDHYHVDFELVK